MDKNQLQTIRLTLHIASNEPNSHLFHLTAEYKFFSNTMEHPP